MKKLETIHQATKHYKKGAYISLDYQKSIKSANGIVIKATNGIVGRLGIKYTAMACNKERNFTTTPNTINKEHYSYCILINKNGEYYLQMFTTFNSQLKAKSTYYYNGAVVSKQWLIDNEIVREKDITSNHTKEIVPCLSFKIDNITRIGKTVLI